MEQRALHEAEREHVRRLIEVHGEREANAILDVSRHTTARLLAGLPVQKGTIALVLQRLGCVAR